MAAAPAGGDPGPQAALADVRVHLAPLAVVFLGEAPGGREIAGFLLIASGLGTINGWRRRVTLSPSRSS
jgi:hypothetical protein